ncbi:MAG: Gfo/Idh/MocA family protein, partial [Spirochaetota bacterium]
MVRVAVVGTGSIHGAHMVAYLSEHERCEIVALCDVKPDKARASAERHGLGAVPVFDDHEALLRTTSVDLVSVCTPPNTHAEITVDALRAGAHVLCEKPMAASLEECDRMIEAASASGRTLSVVSQNRFLPRFWKLKRLLETDALGKLNHIQAESYWWRGDNYYDLWWRGTWESEGGGCTLNHAVHHIDITVWLAGMPERVKAMMTNTSHPNSETEDLSVAILGYRDGALGQITSSVVHHGEAQGIRLQCERAAIGAPWTLAAERAQDNGFPTPNAELAAEIARLEQEIKTPDVEPGPHAAQIRDVLQAIETGSRPTVTGHDGRNALELITAIYAAAITDTTITLPLDSKSPFYSNGAIRLAPRFNTKTRVAD